MQKGLGINFANNKQIYKKIFLAYLSLWLFNFNYGIYIYHIYTRLLLNN